jgi:hypothetical protein
MLALGAAVVISSAGASHASPSPAAPASTPAAAQIPAGNVGALIKFVSTHPAQYSGIYLDLATHHYVVAVPDGQSAPSALSKAVSGLPQQSVTAHASASQVAVTTVQETRSLAQLRKIESQVAQAHGTFGALAKTLIAQWGLNEQTNTVEVGVTRLDPALLAAAKQTYGDSVHVSQVQRAHFADSELPLAHSSASRPGGAAADPASRLLDGQPYSAGDRIGYIHGNIVTQCTSGWIAGVRGGSQTGHDYMFTAGHCFPQGTVVQQGSCTMVDGGCSWQYTGTVGTVNDVQYGDGRMDWLSIDPAGSGSLQQMLYLGGVDSTSGVAEYDLVSSALNEPVCTDGSFTGESCNGTVDATEGCIELSDDSGNQINVCNQDFATSPGPRLVQHGDSGGPVLGDDGGSDATGIAVGVISGGNVGTDADPGPGTELNFTDGGDICNANGEC